jgi:hypothetical protein
MRRVLLVPCLVLLATCNRGPLLLIAVSNLPPEARSLRVLAALSGRDAREAPVYDLSGLEITPQTTYRFGFRLPADMSGALTVSAAAFSDKDCLLTTGDARQVDVAAVRGNISVALEKDIKELRGTCRTAAPVIRSVEQMAAEPGARVRKLRVRGWGFRQGVQVLFRDQAAPAPERLSHTEIQVDEPPLANETGRLQVEARVRNPDQSEDRRTFDLLKVTFAARTYLLPDDFHPDAIALHDVDRDGQPDLVLSGNDKVEMPQKGGLAVLLNQGGGQFPFQAQPTEREPERIRAVPHLYPVAAAAQSVAVGDMNGDGRPDLVFSVPPRDQIGVLANQGQAGRGLFAEKASFHAAGSQPDHLALADLSGDGRLDAAVVNYNLGFFSGLFTTVTVLLNQGDGTLQPPRRYIAGTQVRFVVAREFDDDPGPDLVLFGLKPALDDKGMPDFGRSPTGGVTLLRNQGGGSFSGLLPTDFEQIDTSSSAFEKIKQDYVALWMRTSAVPGAFGTLAAGDVDGDGRPDVLASGRAKAGVATTGGNTVSLLRNTWTTAPG